MGYWIAVVDDEPLSLTNAKNLLRAHDMRVSCLRSGADMLEFIKDHSPDLIILDILMPEMDGFQTYRALRLFEEKNGRPEIPVIFLTGEDSSETERRGLKAGASDYIHKPFDEDILIKRIKNTIINSKTIESLTEEATLDKLTGFLNKTSGTDRVSAVCRNDPGALLILDLDNFKLVNDLYGHDMGDRVLVAFSNVVRHNTRHNDITCRIGGDEFMLYFLGLTREEDVNSLSGRINEEFLKESADLMGKDHGIPLGVSIGGAFSSEKINDYQILFQYADSALYEAKRNGKHGYEIYDPNLSGEEKEQDLERELSHVIQIVSERGEANGAMLLGQEAFSWNYRFIERYLKRYGGAATRILFSLSSDEKGVIFSEMVSEFGTVLKNTLRRTDIILRWQHNRYFVVFPFLIERDTNRVIERIMSSWEETGYSGRLEIQYAVSFYQKALI